jgi:hypothetical protein
MPLFVLLTVAALLVFAPLTAGDGCAFDAEAWKALRGSDLIDNPRAGMIAALETRLTPGTRRSDVLSLLGEPESRDADRFIYDIGVGPYGIDYEYLVIEFAGDRVMRTFIMRG